MPLHVERRDGTPERRVLVAMITSPTVLGPIADRWRFGLFASKYANLVASWCVAHWKEYRDAPGKVIRDYYEQWAASGNKEREITEAVESLLVNLSAEAKQLRRDVSPEYLVNIAGELFEKVRLRELADKITGALERGEIDEAASIVERSRKIEIGVGAGIDVLTDKTAMEAAFNQRHEPLIECPGALGNFYGTALSRGKFLVFLAKPKGAKSFFIRDTCWRAVEQNRNVAYFELGDDVQEDVLMRFAERATGRSASVDEEGIPVRYGRPIKMDVVGDETPEVELQWGEDEPPLDAETTMKWFDKLGADGRFKLSCHPAGQLSISGVESILDRWGRDGWVPDVIGLDYLDLAAPLDARADKMEQINQTWIAARALSQRLKCCVVAATQCNREGFGARTLMREHVGGDYRKLAHVTDMVGINQTSNEKNRQLFRLNRIVGRQYAMGEKKHLWTASCLAISNPVMFSTFQKEYDNDAPRRAGNKRGN